MVLFKNTHKITLRLLIVALIFSSGGTWSFNAFSGDEDPCLGAVTIEVRKETFGKNQIKVRHYELTDKNGDFIPIPYKQVFPENDQQIIFGMSQNGPYLIVGRIKVAAGRGLSDYGTSVLSTYIDLEPELESGVFLRVRGVKQDFLLQIEGEIAISTFQNPIQVYSQEQLVGRFEELLLESGIRLRNDGRISLSEYDLLANAVKKENRSVDLNLVNLPSFSQKLSTQRDFEIIEKSLYAAVGVLGIAAAGYGLGHFSYAIYQNLSPPNK